MFNIWEILLTGWAIVAIFMSILWYIGKRIQIYAIVDVGWTISLWILCVVYLIMGSGDPIRKLLITALVSVWAFRLGGYLLFTRILGGHGEDQRYADFRKDYGDKVDQKFFTNIFQFQGLLDVVLSITFLIPCMNPEKNISIFEYLGIALFVIASIGETIADNQLHKFKSNPENKGKNCEVGLWYYSRHPNYFFEWMIWVSWGLFALGSPYGWVGLISPILMYIFLTKFTGVPLNEKYALEKRGDVYREYQKTTSAFVPWFKKSFPISDR
jgi:steroid 5-alpha reductase family enzyme